MQGRDSGIHFLIPGQQLVINLHMRNIYLCTTLSMSISNQVSRLGEGGACSVKMYLFPIHTPREAWHAAVPGVTKSQRRLSD